MQTCRREASSSPWSCWTHSRIRCALETLPERERKVAILLYVYNLTLREIGEVLGVSESRVCQINRGILRKLRTKLNAHEQLFVAAA